MPGSPAHPSMPLLMTVTSAARFFGGGRRVTSSGGAANSGALLISGGADGPREAASCFAPTASLALRSRSDHASCRAAAASGSYCRFSLSSLTTYLRARREKRSLHCLCLQYHLLKHGRF